MCEEYQSIYSQHNMLLWTQVINVWYAESTSNQFPEQWEI